MPEVNISDIKVGSRFRKKFELIEELAASIQTFGLIEPIILDEENNLIAGERRLRAHMLLKKPTIEVKYIKDLDVLQKKEIELEENIQRKEFTWQEEVAAKAELHKIKQEIHGAARQGVGASSKEGKWGFAQTAEALGETVSNTYIDIKLAQGLEAFPELRNEKSKAAAAKKLKQMQEKILMDELARRMKTKKEVREDAGVIQGNCLEELNKLESSSIDLIVTDPPYGIDIDESQVFDRMNETYVGFDDSEFATFDLLDKAFKEMFRVLKADSHMIVFFGIDKYTAIRTLLEKHGFKVHPFPLIWDKGSGSYPSQSTTFVHSYEPFFHCIKGSRKLNGTPRDVFPVKRVPSNKKVHPTQKPTELLRDLIELCSLPGDVVLDPFSGSGSTLVAAKETGRGYLGIEVNPLYCEAARASLTKEN